MRKKTVITFGFSWPLKLLALGGGGQKIQKGVAGTLSCSILSASHFSMTEIYKKKLHNLKGKGVAARRVISEGRWGRL